MPALRTAAVVINVADHGESDKIITFYTRQQGKQTCIAKGAKRSLKRFVNKLELFSWLDIEYVTGNYSSLARIDQAELTKAFPILRNDYNRFVAANILCELIQLSTRDNDPDPDLFTLLTWALDYLNRGGLVPDALILFHIRLFNLLGYRPQLAACVACHHLEPTITSYSFRVGRNGILCSRCSHDHETGPAGIPVSLSTIKLLGKALELPYEKIERLRFSP
ncbi:MAG: DNA repair protein RecO, partial [Deltaproteobacteria bacterium RIFOXYD12_FULL_50_9]